MKVFPYPHAQQIVRIELRLKSVGVCREKACAGWNGRETDNLTSLAEPPDKISWRTWYKVT